MIHVCKRVSKYIRNKILNTLKSIRQIMVCKPNYKTDTTAWATIVRPCVIILMACSPTAVAGTGPSL
jgi:hypothetical protein